MGHDLRKVSHHREGAGPRSKRPGHSVKVHLRCLESPALGKFDIPKYGTSLGHWM
jgi:hypothetical protein